MAGENKYRVLLVDDSPSMHSMLQEALGAGPFEVVGDAYNGAQGVELFESLKPDLVVMDIVMPQMTGLEALKAIMDKHPEAKVVMLTSMRGKEDVLTAKKHGAKNYVLKPFQPDKLVEILQRVCAAPAATPSAAPHNSQGNA